MLRMWGQLIVQSVTPAEDPVVVGTLWSDTSGAATLYICTAVSPYTWAAVPVGGGGSGITELTGDVTAGPGTGAQAATIANDAVTYAKIQNIATNSLIGRDTAGTGDPETILLNATLSLDGANNLQRAALTGDITAPVGSNTTTIANDVVTYAKVQNVSAASRVLGRGSAAGAGDPEELTVGTGLALTGTVLSATGGAGTPGGSDTQIQFNSAGAFGGDADLTFVTDTLTATKIASTSIDILTAANASGWVVRQPSSTGYVYNEIRNNLNSNVRNLIFGYTGSAYVGPFFTAGTGGEIGAIGTVGAFPLVFATSNNQRMIIDGSSGKVAIGTITIGTAGLAVMSGPLGVGATTTQGTLFEFTGASGVVGVIRGTTAGTYNTVSIYNDQNTGGRAIDLVYTGSTYTGPYFTNGPTGEQGNLGTTGNFPLILGTQNIARITIAGAGGIVINEGGVDADVRMEGDTEANLFFLDASTDRIGVGIATPAQKLHVVGNGSFEGLSLANTGGAATSGSLTLVTGTKTINTTAMTATALLFVQRKTAGGTIGFATTYTQVNGTSFTLNSDSALDTSVYNWWIVETH